MTVGQIHVGLTGAQCFMTAPVTAGLTGAKLEIRYKAPQWQTLGRLVTFRAGKISRSSWETDGTVTIPWEVLQKPGTGLTVGITGTDAQRQVVIPTVPIAICRIQPGAQPGEEADADPALPLWAQLEDRVRKVEAEAVDREDMAAAVYQALEEAKTGGAFTGPKGDPARVEGFAVSYQAGTSGSLVPQGEWSDALPNIPQGQYLWTRTVTRFNSGDPVISYSVSRMGLDGRGSVSSVADISPDAQGNVPLTAAHLHALPDTGGDLTGQLRMQGNPISGLPEPVTADQAANAGYVNRFFRKAAPRNLLDNSDFRNPVNQRGLTLYREAGYTLDRWIKESGAAVTLSDAGIRIDNTAGTAAEVFLQKADRKTADYLLGRQVTLAIKTEEGVFCGSGTVSADSQDVVVYGAGWTLVLHFFMASASYQAARLIVNSGTSILVEWIALYEGEYTTETLPAYQPKGYSAELAACRRYYFAGDVVLRSSLSHNGNVANLVFPTQMRLVPTVSVNTIEGAVPDVINVSANGVSWYSQASFTFDRITASADL